jgi:WD40 repeat protein
LGDHSWSGDNQRAFRDIVYYQIRMGSRSLTELHDTLCNLYFIEKRCALDASAVYDLTADFETVLDILRQNTAVVTRAIRRQRFLGVKRRSMQAALQKQSKLNSAAQESSSGNGSGNDVETATKANLEAVNHATSLVNDTNTSLQNSQNSTVSETIPDSTTKIQPNTRTPAQLLSKAAHVFNMQGRVRGLKRLQPNAITITEEKKQEDADRSREFFRNGHVLNMPEFPTDTRDSHAIKSFVEQLLRRLSDFLHMVRSQSHVLAVSPSLTFQLALTQSPSCGPYLAAQKRIDACMTPSSWIEWVNRPEQDLKLVDRVANSRCNCVAVSVEIAAVGFEDSSIQIIAIENLKVRQELHAHDDGVTALAWARTLLASGDRTGRIIVWNTYNFSIVYNLDGHQGVINDLDFSDEGRHLVSVCNDATMRIWSTYLEDYDEIQTVWDRSHVSSLTAVAYFNKVCSSSRSRRTLINRSSSHNTDTKLIACGAASGKVVVWDASALSLGVEIIFRLHCHTREVNGLEFNDVASLLCSGSLDDLVGIWDM